MRVKVPRIASERAVRTPDVPRGSGSITPILAAVAGWALPLAPHPAHRAVHPQTLEGSCLHSVPLRVVRFT